MAWKFDGTEDIIDSRDIIARIEELEALEDTDIDEFRQRFKELEELYTLHHQGNSSPDWNYGEQLIRESYFEDYIAQLIDDCYPEVSKALSSSEWPMRHLKLDVEAAAWEAMHDYYQVMFNGSPYLIRA